MKHIAPAMLIALGLLAMAGDLLGIASLKGFGAATAASPAPKVFSAVRGYETYSTQFFIEWDDEHGREQSIQLTPELYAGLRGPYNRRNVYGAALAYGPVLSTDARTQAMFEAVARFALTGDAPVLRELGIDLAASAGALRVRYEPRPGTGMGTLPRRIEVGPR